MDKRKLLPKRQRTDDGRVMRTGPLNGIQSMQTYYYYYNYYKEPLFTTLLLALVLSFACLSLHFAGLSSSKCIVNASSIRQRV